MRQPFDAAGPRWRLVNYGFGSANRNLPSFVVMLDDHDPIGGAKQWSAGFLPATYQGMQFRQGDTPLLHLKPPMA